MSITDLTSMSQPQSEHRKKVENLLANLGENIEEICFQCGKCTSGCEAHKLLELEPHKIMALTSKGFIDEMTNSDIIWTCITCLKCKERCPQRVTPVDVLYALKNMAIASGKQVPGDYTNMLQTVLQSGYTQGAKDVPDRENQTHNREALGLPPISGPADPMKFQQAIMKAFGDTLL